MTPTSEQQHKEQAMQQDAQRPVNETVPIDVYSNLPESVAGRLRKLEQSADDYWASVGTNSSKDSEKGIKGGIAKPRP